MTASREPWILWLELWLVVVGWGGCQSKPPEEKTQVTEPSKTPTAIAPQRSLADRMGTRFTAPPSDFSKAPKFVEIPIPQFPGTTAIWGASGRDDRGHIWLGVMA